MIQIWEDPWLPTPRAHPARSLVNILDKRAKVFELLDENTNWWNMALVQEIFNEVEAKMICSMRVCRHRETDILAWENTQNKSFTIRSAYHLALERFEEGEGSCSNN